MEDKDKGEKYRLGIAFSGGGARGFAHAGALMAIEEVGLKPDVLAGVSAGSVVAVLYAGGVSPLGIAEIFARTNFRDFTELSIGQGGFFNMEKFGRFIERALGGKTTFEQLSIPVYVSATNLDDACPTVFSSGSIKDLVAASCSIPILFKPVKIDGADYVDGGVLRNHPAWILRDKCDTLIGINVSPLVPKKTFKSIVDVALRTYNLMAKANQKEDMDLCDISVEIPALVDYTVFDLKHIKEIFVSGYVAMRDALRRADMWHPEKETCPRISKGQSNNL